MKTIDLEEFFKLLESVSLDDGIDFNKVVKRFEDELIALSYKTSNGSIKQTANQLNMKRLTLVERIRTNKNIHPVKKILEDVKTNKGWVHYADILKDPPIDAIGNWVYVQEMEG